MLRRLWFVLLTLSTPGFADDVGYYIGSFDPPTLGHRDVVLRAMEAYGLSKVYITVNHNTAKDFNASIDERLQMMRLLFAGSGDRIEILREPLEGRVDFARYLLDKHQNKLLGIFGDDTFEKNFSIFRKVANFDYIKVARPMVATESVDEEAYVPIIHDMDVDADGVSSSLARDQINHGIDPVGVLDRSVIEYIKLEKIYRTPPPHHQKTAQASFLARFRTLTADLKQAFPSLNLDGLSDPVYKPSQTVGAQNDKMIRHIVEYTQMDLEGQFLFRPVAEARLNIQLKSRPLREPRRAGIFAGSFDPLSADQRDVVRNAFHQLDVEVLYVVVLETSRKPITLSLEARVAQAKAQLASFGNRVIVTTARDPDSLPSVVKRLKNEHRPPTVALFGANVLEANVARMKGIRGLRFAVVSCKDLLTML